MNEKQKPDLSTIEPIGKLPEDEPASGRLEEDVRSSESDAAESQSGPSDEERELEKLRRG